MVAMGEVIGERYTVGEICSDTGGMGCLFHVVDTANDWPWPLVMKVCRDADEEAIQRFKREVRLLQEFAGNKRVVRIVDADLDHDPPYYVMPYYENGDLTTLATKLQSDLTYQEETFYQIIDCVDELHQRNTFHRDIKPQNFLRDGKKIVVSDLGLSTELASATAFTKSSKFWGTPGYLPPEFHSKGGFKNADASSDVFMLGKTFYVLLSGRGPMYLAADDIPGPIFAVIERCCAQSKVARYSSLASLRQSLHAAYDVLLGRVVGPKKAGQILRAIHDRLVAENKYVTTDVKDFIERLSLLDLGDQIQMCTEIKGELFDVIAQAPFKDDASRFLNVYQRLVEDGDYGWSYAETIADNMKRLVESPALSSSDRATALRLAIHAADRMNRFAAMDTCRKLVKGIDDEELGMRVREVLLEYQDRFIGETEPTGCESAAVRNALQEIQAAKAE